MSLPGLSFAKRFAIDDGVDQFLHAVVIFGQSLRDVIHGTLVLIS